VAQTKPQTWLLPLLPALRQMSNTVWCFLVGERTIFPVDIDQTKTVGHLKEAITQKKRQRLGDVDPDHLTLYRVVIDGSLDQGPLIDELNRLSQNLQECTRLKERSQLSEIVGKTPQGKEEYILVQPPEGESIVSRACSVVLMYPTPLSLTQALACSAGEAGGPSPGKTVSENLRPHISFKLQSSKTTTNRDLAVNKISPLPEHELVPPYIAKLQGKLSQKRVVIEAEAVSALGFFFPFSFLFLWGRGERCAMHRSALGPRLWDSGAACHWVYLLVGQLCRPTFPPRRRTSL
jgi:hypothetical protein